MPVWEFKGQYVCTGLFIARIKYLGNQTTSQKADWWVWNQSRWFAWSHRCRWWSCIFLWSPAIREGKVPGTCLAAPSSLGAPKGLSLLLTEVALVPEVVGWVLWSRAQLPWVDRGQTPVSSWPSPRDWSPACGATLLPPWGLPGHRVSTRQVLFNSFMLGMRVFTSSDINLSGFIGRITAPKSVKFKCILFVLFLNRIGKTCWRPDCMSLAENWGLSKYLCALCPRCSQLFYTRSFDPPWPSCKRDGAGLIIVTEWKGKLRLWGWRTYSGSHWHLRAKWELGTCSNLFTSWCNLRSGGNSGCMYLIRVWINEWVIEIGDSLILARSLVLNFIP